MSHEATIWAIKQTGRGLSPGAKLVLWHLADRHNPDHGCFPKQARLAADCEMARSTLNTHLATLEERGLIRREKRHHPQAKTQMSTRYVFAFEPSFGAQTSSSNRLSAKGAFAVEKPCPVSGHGSGSVSELDAKPCPEIHQSRVRLVGHVEPVIEPIKEPVPAPLACTENNPDRAGLGGLDHCREQSAGARPEPLIHPDSAQSEAASAEAVENAASTSAAAKLHHTATIWAKQIREQRYVTQLAPEVLSYMLRTAMVTEQQMLQAGLSPP